jgi:hypothetical protein
VSDVSIIISTNADQVGKKIKGLTGDVIGAAGQAKALASAMKFLDASFNKGKITGEQYSKAVQRLDKAEDALYKSIGQANTAIKQQEAVAKSATVATSKAAVAAQRLTKSQRMSGKSTNKFGMFAQQVGYQVGDFNVQVQSGTNALVAFGQQGTQLAGLLPGLGGAILGIGLSLATAALRSKEQTEGLTFSFKAMKDDIAKSLASIKPLLDGLSKAISAVTSFAVSFGKVLVDNLDRVATYVIVAASAFAGKFVAGLIAARVATFSLAGAFAFLRTAIIRTGIGAIIVAVAEAILLFGKMSKAVGGVGPLLELLKDAFVETLGKISTKLQWMRAMASAQFYGLVKDGLKALDDLLAKVNSNFVNKFIGFFAGAISGSAEYVKSLPSIFVEVFKSVKRAVADGVNSFTGIIGEGINKLREKLGMDKLNFGDFIDVSGMAKGDVAGALSDAQSRISGAFTSALNTDYVGSARSGLASGINSADKAMQGALKDAVSLDASLKRPTKAVEALKDAFANLGSETSAIDVTSWFTGKGKDDEGSGSSLADTLTEAQQRVQGIADNIQSSMSDAFMSMVDGTKSVKDAFKDMARAIIRQLYDVLVVQQLVGSFDAKTGDGSGIVGAIFGAKASGGTVMPNQPYLVGEKGPELIMPQNRGHVMNADLTAKAMGGSGEAVVVNQTFNFAANGDDSVKRLIAQAAPQIAQMTQKQIMDSRRRGGAMKSTFG